MTAWEFFGKLLALVFFMGILCYLGVFVHEMGHLCGCLLVGWKPLTVNIGAGKKKTFLRIGDLSFMVGARPFSGSVKVIATRREWYRVKHFIFTLAGPLATLALFLSALKVLYMPDQSPYQWIIHPFILWFVITQALFLAGCLYPKMGAFDGRKLPTDGLRMWRCLTMTGPQAEVQFASHCRTLALLRIGEGRFQEAEAAIKMALKRSEDTFDLKWNLICILCAAGKSEEAKTAMAQLSQVADPGGRSRSQILDALASIPIYSGQMLMLDESIRYVEQALAEAPEEVTLKGTRASLLIEKGALDQGMQLLEEVLAKTESNNDRAICKYYMALAHHRKGESALAYEWLREAHKIDPGCPVHKRIEDELAGAPPVSKVAGTVTPASS